MKKFLFLALTLFSFSSFAQSPNDALAAVKYQNKWAYINKEGTIVLPGIFDNAGPFKEGVAPAQIGQFWGYVSPDGRWAIKPVFVLAFPFNNNRAHAHFYDKADTFNHPIYINHKAEFIHELVWGEEGFDYHDGYVRVLSSNTNGFAVGFRDTLGNWAIKPRYDAAMDFSGGYAAVLLGDYWGYTNPKDSFLVFPKYKEAGPYQNGYAWVKDEKRQYFLDKKGKQVLKVSLSKEVAPRVSDGLIAFREGGKIGFMNIKGKTVIKAQYENKFLPAFNDGLVAVQKGGKYGFIDKTGKEVIPFQYDEAFGFNEGLARVKVGDKFGFIDKTGKYIMEPKLDDAKDFSGVN